MDALLLVLVQPNANAGEDGSAERGSFLDFGHLAGPIHHVGLFLHPEFVAHRTASLASSRMAVMRSVPIEMVDAPTSE
jgi:hypothetical protein